MLFFLAILAPWRFAIFFGSGSEGGRLTHAIAT
jgi:hypothetical protein